MLNIGPNILITGGTGSFGQACTKHLMKNEIYPNGKILIYSRDEHKQEKMRKDFKELDKTERLRFFIGDIRDKDRLFLAVKESDYVIHAAALKVVPTAEYNPFEYIKTNIIGSQNLIDLYTQWGSAHNKIIALSTDKAVNPINLYGATKLCMEKIFMAANNVRGVNGPKFSVARYGNVANSNGSVIQVFKEQREKNLPLTITHRDMTRYWITLEDAVKFVIESLSKMQGKEIFIPDMPSFKVLELLYAFGYPNGFKETGIREGEKLHEQIDVGEYSNSNLDWLNSNDLKEQLKRMGVI